MFMGKTQLLGGQDEEEVTNASTMCWDNCFY